MGEKKKRRIEENTVITNPRDIVASLLNEPTSVIPANHKILKRYPLNPPFSEGLILRDETDGELIYVVDEIRLTQVEAEKLAALREVVEHEFEPSAVEGENARSYRNHLMELIDSHRKLFGETPALSIEKIIYYLERDVFGFGLLDALMHDQSVEDISCSGANKHIYVWQKEFDSLKTNLMFRSEQDLDDFVMKEVHRAGKHTSAAFPIADVTLPGKHRLAVYYKDEVTPFGSSFTIRKFREDPLTAIDLIETGTIDEAVAAYFWLLMDNKLSMMVLGATGAGKTTTLNAVCCLIQPSNKICTIEEISEINLPHENWVSLVTRSGFGIEGEGEITLFQLIKSALRHRPDHLVVGEVRGEEAYVLFQALATGHGGLCTMHADSTNSAIQRLGQRPMEIAPGNIPLMNCAAVVKKVKQGNQSGGPNYYGSSRRIIQVSEIIDPESPRNIFSWNPASDIFDIDITSSHILRKIAASNGLTWDELLDEFERRRIVLGWMAQSQFRDYRTVSNILASYRREPDKIYEKAASALDLSKKEW